MVSLLYYSIIQQWAKQHYYVRSRNKPITISEMQLNLQKHTKICCNFIKISIRRRKCCCKKILS